VTEYYWGDEIDPSYAYYWDNSKGVAEYARDVTTCPVAALDKKYPGYCANDFGLMHMLGNVWQWTADAYVNSYTNAPTDGNVAVAGDAGSYRVFRGGSWGSDARFLRSSFRGDFAPVVRYDLVGFRLVRTPK
jgi:formylglycine-generating enzyme required for sulfatase activity